MACYISRLDDQGNEIEHISSRTSSVSTGSCAGSNRRSFRQRSIRFVNRAAYIERIDEKGVVTRNSYHKPPNERSNLNSELVRSRRLNDDVDENCDLKGDVGVLNGLNREDGEHSNPSCDESENGSLDDEVGWCKPLSSQISETNSFNRGNDLPNGDVDGSQSGVSEASSPTSDVEENVGVCTELSKTSRHNCNSVKKSDLMGETNKVGRFGREIEIPKIRRSCTSLVSAFSDTSSLNDLKYIEDKKSHIVPSLDIPSTDNTTSPRWNTYSMSGAAPIIVRAPNLAYEEWLSAKRRVKAVEAARRKRQEEAKRKEKEERLRLAKEKYDQWLKNKARQQTSSDKKQQQKSESEKGKTKKQRNEEEARIKLEEWERKKRLEEERRRKIKLQEEQQRREWEEKRRQMSAEAWEKWVRDAAKKPKPVPLNRGIFTLRGTVSDIYVNPNEWQDILPVVDDY